jgi:1-acyl-sn-glycerol-3-phosphate acyltransferase
MPSIAMAVARAKVSPQGRRPELRPPKQVMDTGSDATVDPSWFQPVHRKAWIVALFSFWVRGMLRRHFHAVHLHREALLPLQSGEPECPAVIFLNHASWWDPLVMLYLSRCLFPSAEGYAPIEAEQLRRYAFFRWLGLFAVRAGSSSGGRDFLRAARLIIERDSSMLWITPEGRFVDVRERPVRFAPGIAHLALRHPRARFVPLAVEYAFGMEKLPEVYLRFGNALSGEQWGATVAEAQERMERALEETQTALASEVVSQKKTGFERLLSGKKGASLPYDLWRRFRAWCGGHQAVLQHAMDRDHVG